MNSSGINISSCLSRESLLTWKRLNFTRADKNPINNPAIQQLFSHCFHENVNFGKSNDIHLSASSLGYLSIAILSKSFCWLSVNSPIQYFWEGFVSSLAVTVRGPQLVRWSKPCSWTIWRRLTLWLLPSFAHRNRRFKLKDAVPNFRSLEDFHSYILCSSSEKTLSTVLESELTENATRAVLTKGDLASHNINISPETSSDEVSGDILGIVDWVMFGWYPVYWEQMFIMMSCRFAQQRIELERAFDGALEQHLRELALVK